MKKQYKGIPLLLALAMLMTGCGSGSLPANVGQETSETSLTEASVPILCQRYEDQFTAGDGTTEIRFSFECGERLEAPAIVDVIPRDVTEADVRRVVESAFGTDTTVYALRQADSELDWEPLTKGEIQERLDRWSIYLEPDALKELTSYEVTEDQLARVQSAIDRYRVLQESAPETIEDVPLDWVYSEDQNYPMYDALKGRLFSNGYTYSLSATVQELPISDYRVSRIYIRTRVENDPADIDYLLQTRALYKTQPATQAQLDAILEKAGQILEGCGLGQWCITSWLDPYGESQDTLHMIRITAMASLGGAEAAWNERIEGTSVSNLGTATMSFTVDGKITALEINCPVEVVSQQPADKLLSEEALVGIAKNSMRCYTRENLNMSGTELCMEKLPGRNLGYREIVNRIRYGLVRVPDPNVRTYRYVPGIILYAKGEIFDMDTGEKLDSVFRGHMVDGDGSLPCLVINALDGSIVYEMIGT